jgi:deoxycytidine triphosphate deaminase/intein/homing endonuclease
MSIKNDRWIRRMSAQGMIDPFSPDQVRMANGHKIVSYGTSSYGYDVRCAEDFKIFTNINSTIVDPKAFDEKSFVDFRGPVCIIPPNSFALASTVEYFRIPRSVLTVCLGKCVTGDTRVVDADSGAYLPITEMRWGKSTLAWNGRRLERAKVSAFIPQGRREVFELRTRAGLKIRATANHPFLTVKKWTALSELRVGDRIAVARDMPVFGKTPIPDPDVIRLARTVSSDTSDSAVPQSIFMAPEASARLFLQTLFGDDGRVPRSHGGRFVEYRSHSRRLIEDVRHLLLRFGVFSVIREQVTSIGTQAVALQITDENAMTRFAEQIGPAADVSGRSVQDLKHVPIVVGNLRVDVEACFGGHDGGASGSGMSSPHSAALEMADFTNDSRNDALLPGPVWDDVETIEPIGAQAVFDITVPGLHNFVANDFIVHNSTYARCFRGDTRVALVDGSAPTLEEMARRRESGEIFWGYSIGPNGRMIVTCLDAPRFIGRDSLLEVELDSGESVHATPDHLFMRRDGRMAAAHELRPGDALMPLYRDLIRGDESVHQPIDGHLCPTHRMADEWNLRNGMYADVPGSHWHHMDCNRRNNRPTNIERMEASGQTTLRRYEDPAARAQQSELMIRAWAQDDGARRSGQAETARGIRLRAEISEQSVRRTLDDSGSIRGAAQMPGCDRSVFHRFPEMLAQCRGTPAYRNHKVVAIRSVAGDHDVFCLTVPEAGNFALESGVFVKNCGIIVNVTPLEPEWEGHVTLEFSNTTPLPAKIYANEGVAQMLFFESDEVCETSYADRGGKYQGQRGVTLPKT